MKNINIKTLLLAALLFSSGTVLGALGAYKHYAVEMGVQQSVSNLVEKSLAKAKIHPTVKNVDYYHFWNKAAHDIATEFANTKKLQNGG